MMKDKPWISIIVLLLLASSASAQYRADFKRDSVSFRRYTVSLMNSLSGELENKGAFFEKNFTEAWYSGRYSKKQRDTVYTTTASILNKRLYVYPVLFKYLLLTDYLIGNEQFFNEWHSSLDDMLKLNKKDNVQAFIERSYSLFIKNHLYRESTVNWKIKADTFQFNPGVEPSVNFKKCTLTGYSQTDTSVIHQTSGVFYPLSLRWEGFDGKVFWTRAGYDTSRLYTKLKDYSFEASQSHFEVDSALLIDSRLFDEPLIGRFTEGFVYQLDSSNINYPQFVSSRFFSLTKLIDSTIFRGYLRYSGNNIIVSSGDSPDKKAVALLQKNQEKYISVQSDRLFVGQQGFSSYNAGVSIYIGEHDSISHPSVNFNYNEKSGEFKLFSEKEEGKIMPYTNTYHNLDMYCRILNWNRKDRIIEFQSIQSMGVNEKAIFESHNFYTERSYYKIQLMDRINPLKILHKLDNQKKRNVLTNRELMRFTGKSAYQTDLLLLRLAKNGFLVYNRKSKTFRVKSKVHNYVLAKYGLRDYDEMRLISEAAGENNAELNLKTKELEIRGIPAVKLSGAQKVQINPEGSKIRMKKNRSFSFSGRIRAGNTILYGDSSYFDYKSFSISLPSIDSMRIYLPQYDRDQKKKYYRPVKTVLENLSGQLKIDQPGNKSGTKKTPRYPILKTSGESFAYYDKYAKYKSVYDRERFKYHVEPFTIDSLDNFYPEAMSFDGYLESSIFPDIYEELTLQPDFSLGFQTRVSDSGISAYQDKGRYYDSLRLSNQGLIGGGRLDYLTSSSNANRVIFFPDSAKGLLEAFHLEERSEGVEYPLVDADTAKMRWLPMADSMVISDTRVPFSMYKDEVELKGSLALTPEALRGEGEATYDKALIYSGDFSFMHRDMTSESGDITILTPESKQKALQITNYSSYININDKEATFNQNKEGSLIRFPYNSYISYLDQIDWSVSDDLLELTATKMPGNNQLDSLSIREIVDVELSGARFVSTNPEQDSISFYALKAKYDLKNSIIEAEQVKYINVADAAIFPDKEVLRIGRNASIRVLQNAKILATRQDKSHYVDSARVDIRTRHSYFAEGDYHYFDEKAMLKEIAFDSIWVSKGDVTRGLSKIKESVYFALSPYFDYFGDIYLDANEPLLQFDGYYRLSDTLCQDLSRPWVKFNSRVNGLDVQLPVQYPLYDTALQKMQAGYMFNPGKRQIYPLFLEKDTVVMGYPFWESSGYIHYHEPSHQYRIASREKLLDDKLYEPFYYYDTKECSYQASGTLDFGELFGRVNITPVGEITSGLSGENLEMKAIMGVDFFFDQKTQNMMADTIKNFDLDKRIEFEGRWSKASISNFLEEEQAESFLEDIELYGEPREIFEKLVQSLFFYDLHFKWNNNLKSLIAEGPIGLGNIGEQIISRYIKGAVEIQPTHDGGHLNIYLEPQPGVWYYFSYSEGYMDAVSSDMAFNKRLRDIKDKKRRLKPEEGKPYFEYLFGGVNLKEFFLQRIKKAGVELK